MPKYMLPVCILMITNMFWSVQLDGYQTREDESITRFAPQDCLGVVYIDIESLCESENYRNLPLDIILPSAFSLDRFRETPLSELAIFVSEGSTSDFEVSAVAKLTDAKPNEESILESWKQIPRKFLQEELPITRTAWNGTTVFRVPSGTFLNPQRTKAVLSFAARDGSASPRGVSIGNVDAMSYVPGGTRATATATFSGITQETLKNKQLHLVVEANIFRIAYSENESFNVQVTVRNPKSGLTSAPLNFGLKSFQTTNVALPTKLFSKNSHGESKEQDLFDDFVVDGSLEIIFKPENEDCYLGIDNNSISVDSGEAEFITFADDRVFVGQSMTALKNMLQNQDRKFPKRLELAHANCVLFANIQTQRQRESFTSFLESISLANVTKHFPAKFIFSAWATYKNEGQCRFELEVANPQVAQSLAKSIQGELTSTAVRATKAWLESVRNIDVRDGLRSLFQLATEGSFPPRNVKEQNFERHGQRKIMSWFEKIHTTVVGDKIALEVRNMNSAINDSEVDQWFLTSLMLARMLHFHEQKQFELSDAIHRRVTERHSTNMDSWLRRAHQLAYNTSPEFDGIPARYPWVRRGIGVMLDGAEENPESIAPIYKTAFIIGHKIGRSDEWKGYQEHFSADQELHRRLTAHIDLADARDSSGQVDAWLAARALFNRCIAMHVDEGKPTTKEYFFLFSRPARSHAGYAESLDKKGQHELAAKEWTKTRELLLQFGEQELASWNNLRLNYFDEDSANLDLESKKQIGDLLAHFHGWLWRSEFEQSVAGRSIRQWETEALIFESDEDFLKANEKLDSAMKLIVQEYEANTDCGDECLQAYMNLIEAYLDISKRTDSHNAAFDSFLATYHARKDSMLLYFWF